MQADVFLAQGAQGVFGGQRKTHVHLNAAHCGEIVALAVKEQAVKQGRGRFNGGRLARAHDAVNIHERGVAVHVLVSGHRVADVGAHIDVIDVEHGNVVDACVQQLLEGASGHFAILVDFPSQFVASFDVDRPGFFVDDVLSNEAADDLIKGHQQFGDFAFVLELFDRARGDLVTCFADHLTGGRIHKVIGRAGASNTIGEEGCGPAAIAVALERHGVKVGIHNAFLIEAQRI